MNAAVNLIAFYLSQGLLQRKGQDKLSSSIHDSYEQSATNFTQASAKISKLVPSSSRCSFHQKVFERYIIQRYSLSTELRSPISSHITVHSKTVPYAMSLGSWNFLGLVAESDKGRTVRLGPSDPDSVRLSRLVRHLSDCVRHLSDILVPSDFCPTFSALSFSKKDKVYSNHLCRCCTFKGCHEATDRLLRRHRR